MSTLIRPPLASFPAAFPATADYPVIPTDGLVGWFEFDDGSGTTVTDRSGEGNHGTIAGAAGWSAQGLVFDGVDDVVTTGVPGSLEFDWIVLLNPTSGTPSFKRIMGDYLSTGDDTGANCYVDTSITAFRMITAKSDGGAVTSTVPGSAVADTWHIVSFRRRGSGTAATQGIYVEDGDFDRDSMVVGGASAGNPVLFGDAFQQNATQRFKGTIAAALLYNRPLTADERIQAIFYLRLLAAERSITV